jgi:hypothetical protein
MIYFISSAIAICALLLSLSTLDRVKDQAIRIKQLETVIKYCETCESE